MAATNPYGVISQRPDPDAPFAPDTMTFHGWSIEVGETVIGRVTQFTPPAMRRQVNLVRELNPRTFGRPVDIVPGIDEEFTMAFSRTEVWRKEVEREFGEANVYALLTDQRRPFIIRESYMRGNALYRQWSYLGCWFTEKSTEGFAAEGDAMVKISGTVMFVARIQTR